MPAAVISPDLQITVCNRSLTDLFRSRGLQPSGRLPVASEAWATALSESVAAAAAGHCPPPSYAVLTAADGTLAAFKITLAVMRSSSSQHVIAFFDENAGADSSQHLQFLGQLALAMVHEINNPLASVVGFSQLALTHDIPAAAASDLQRIHSAGVICRDSLIGFTGQSCL